MPNQFQNISLSTQKQIARLVKRGLSNRAIARKLGVHDTTVLRYRHAPAKPVTVVGPAQVEEGIRAALRRGDLSAGDLARETGAGVRAVRSAIAEMKHRGVLITELPGGVFSQTSVASLEGGRHEIRGNAGEWTHRFGVTTDNHLCNRQSRLDVLNAAYDHFEREGIRTVLNAGNWIDGEAKFNKTELVTAPGMDNQLDYMIDKWPVRKSITTLYIAGDDHEGWYAQREGIQIGRYLELRAQQQGRNDLKYLGYGECDIALRFASGVSVMRAVHPGGGSAYAISYTDQKRVESYQGGEKPRVEVVGHYHKWNHGYPREVHTIQCGCTCDQTLFMRKKRIQAHVGFVVINIKQDERGIVTRVAPEWFPFFDRGFYEKRYR